MGWYEITKNTPKFLMYLLVLVTLYIQDKFGFAGIREGKKKLLSVTQNSFTPNGDVIMIFCQVIE